MLILAHKNEFILPKGVEPTKAQEKIVAEKTRTLKNQGRMKVRIPDKVRNLVKGGAVNKRAPVKVQAGQYVLPFKVKPTPGQLKKISRRK